MARLSDEIGSDLELFVDKHRIASLEGVRLRLHAPRRAEVAVRFDRPWEGPASAYVTVFEDGGHFRMYYRGWPGEDAPDQTCYAESDDGIQWTKPHLRLFDWEGSRDNNIVWRGVGVHNFTPFRDPRPGVPASEQYKAVGRGLRPRNTLHAFVSPDGFSWKPLSDEPVFVEGKFDSQNLAFWDTNAKRYRCYFRTPYEGKRGIGVVESQDFRTWSSPRLITLDPPTPEHFYTNATLPYFRNPSYYLAFPKRFNPSRQRLPNHESRGISEAVLLSSRDGEHFDRTFMEAWIRPGRDPRNWGDRSTMPAWGILPTGEDEMSVYFSQHYRFETAHLRRGVLRLDGFASAHAGYGGGELLTTPVRFRGDRLVINYATAASGSLRVEIRNRFGETLPGFTLDEAVELYGDAIEETYRWKNGSDVSSLQGEAVQLRLVLKDCDLYSYRFTREAAPG